MLDIRAVVVEWRQRDEIARRVLQATAKSTRHAEPEGGGRNLPLHSL
jgi:hypothetical protein